MTGSESTGYVSELAPAREEYRGETAAVKSEIERMGVQV